MRSDCVLAGEELSGLSARLGVPACMLMRANGLYSPAWLLPGREVLVPEGTCGGGFTCPREAIYRMAGAPEREALLPVDAGGRLLFLGLNGAKKTKEAE